MSSKLMLKVNGGRWMQGTLRPILVSKPRMVGEFREEGELDARQRDRDYT